MGKKTKTTAVRSWRFEVVGLSRESCERWWRLQDDCRELTNMWWQEWETRHIAAGDGVAVRGWMRAFAAARKAGAKKQDLPKCPVDPMPSDEGYAKSLYEVIAHSEVGQRVHTRTIVLQNQQLRERLTGKDSDGRWNLWQAVLACRQGRPSAERDQPISLDKVSCTLPIKSERSNRWRCTVTLARERSEGAKMCESIRDDFEFIAKGSGASIAERIASGEYKFRGSKVFYSRSKRKWFFSLCYSKPAAEIAVQGDGTMVVWPGESNPWNVSINGSEPFQRGGPGFDIAFLRKKLSHQRWRENKSFHYGSSSRRGHGRNRALGPVQKYEQRWRKIVSSRNAGLSTELVRLAVARRCGTLVYRQPTGSVRDNRFLSVAGKVEGRRDASLWDYAQFGTMLAWKCQDAGVHFVLEKWDEDDASGDVAKAAG